jgi:hypothetical protein
MLSTQPLTRLFREGGLSGTAGVRGVGGGQISSHMRVTYIKK